MRKARGVRNEAVSHDCKCARPLLLGSGPFSRSASHICRRVGADVSAARSISLPLSPHPQTVHHHLSKTLTTTWQQYNGGKSVCIMLPSYLKSCFSSPIKTAQEASNPAQTDTLPSVGVVPPAVLHSCSLTFHPWASRVIRLP